MPQSVQEIYALLKAALTCAVGTLIAITGVGVMCMFAIPNPFLFLMPN